MPRNETLPPAVMVAAARKVDEALGLLAMLRPLCKRAKSLTRAEQDTFQEVLSNAQHVFHQLSQGLYEARYGPPPEARDLAPTRNGRPAS